MTDEVKIVATGDEAIAAVQEGITSNVSSGNKSQGINIVVNPITQKLTTQEAHLMLKINGGETHLMSIPAEMTQDFEKLLAKGFVKVDGVRAALTLHGHAFIHGLETHIANWI